VLYPAIDRPMATIDSAANVTPGRAAERPRRRGDLIALPGGKFLMGTDYAEAFPADGEGPVREVQVYPFEIDVVSVTNKMFSEFITDTSYQTEAERYGWSFVSYTIFLQCTCGGCGRYRGRNTVVVQGAWGRLERS